jgi:hypothetical protein
VLIVRSYVTSFRIGDIERGYLLLIWRSGHFETLILSRENVAGKNRTSGEKNSNRGLVEIAGEELDELSTQGAGDMVEEMKVETVVVCQRMSQVIMSFAGTHFQ